MSSYLPEAIDKQDKQNSRGGLRLSDEHSSFVQAISPDFGNRKVHFLQDASILQKLSDAKETQAKANKGIL